MARARSTARKPRKKTAERKSLLPWLALLGVTVGAIGLYDNRASFFPKDKAPVQRGAEAKVAPTAKPPVNVQKPQPRPSTNMSASAKPNAPVPPKPINGGVSLPTERPQDVASLIRSDAASRPATAQSLGQAGLVTMQAAAEAGKPGSGKPISAQFVFCGRSGFKNCVEDGHVFWLDGKKIVLSDVSVARTENAACVDERRKGFSAKVRLRDFLNAGGFHLASNGGQNAVTRNGQSFTQSLLRDGLAKPIEQKNQSWCS